MVQGLMRHAGCRCTLQIDTHARLEAKREAQHRAVEMIFSPEQETDRSATVLAEAEGPAAEAVLA